MQSKKGAGPKSRAAYLTRPESESEVDSQPHLQITRRITLSRNTAKSGQTGNRRARVRRLEVIQQVGELKTQCRANPSILPHPNILHDRRVEVPRGEAAHVSVSAATRVVPEDAA